jgi:hypothetical protein
MRSKLLILAASIILITSCTKTQQGTTTNLIPKATRSESYAEINGVQASVTNGILKFKSLDDYSAIYEVSEFGPLQNFANAVSALPNFTTYYSTIPSTDENKDQFAMLGKLLNSNSIIRIGEFTILVDFGGSKVYAKTDGVTDEMLAAKAGQSIIGMLTFDIHDDVIEELKLKKTRGLFCSDPWRPAQSDSRGMAFKQVFSSDADWGTLCAKYWPAGIYFELNSKVTTTYSGSYFTHESTWSWQRRCGKSGSGTRTYSTPIKMNTDKNFIYYNVRALTSGSVSAKLSSSNATTPGAVVIVSI